MPICSSTRQRFLVCALVSAILAASPSGAAVFYVGTGTGCTHQFVSQALAAAAANGPDLDIIRITSLPIVIGNVQMEVNDHSVLIVGGFANCTASTPTSRTSVTFLSSDGDHGFWVHGATTVERFFGLTNMDLVMGVNAGHTLLLQDMENVLLDNTTLSEGKSIDQGGNVRMQGEVFLQVTNHSQISQGHALFGSGGGIHCENGGYVYLDPTSEVLFNHAQDSGGGVFGYGCTIASSGSISHNNADKGGGIYAAGGSTVELTGRSGALSLVADNFGGTGAGLFLVDGGTTAVARNAAITGNRADLNGGGVWVGIGGTTFTMDVDPATCSEGRGCSSLSGNFAETGNSGALLVAGGSSATVRQTTIFGNYTEETAPGSVAVVVGTLLMEGCEIFGNTNNSYPEVSRFYVTGTATIAYSTIVEPTVSADVFWVWAGSSFKLFSSIVRADHTFRAPAVAANIDCVVTKEQTSFPAGGTFLSTVTDPTQIFQNYASADYRLKRFSVAADFCDTNFYVPTDGDFDNQARGWDDPAFTNVIGPFDLGADEWRPDLFLDGFEAGNTLRWLRLGS